MDKCLVTKLQGVVDDDTLLKLGEIRISVNASVAGKYAIFTRYYVEGSRPLTLKSVDGLAHISTASGGGYVNEIAFNEDYTKTQNIYFGVGEYEISLVHRAALGSFIAYDGSVLGFDAAQLAYMPKLRSFVLYKPFKSFDISELRYMPVLEILELGGQNIVGNLDGVVNIGGCKNLSLNDTAVADNIEKVKDFAQMEILDINNSTGITGDITRYVATLPLLKRITTTRSINLTGNVANLVNNTNLENVSINLSNIGGDISYLGKLTKLTTLQIADANNLSGSIESMVAAFRANGRQAGSISMPNASYVSPITYNGERLRDWVRTNLPGVNNVTLSWTADNITIS